MLKLHLEGKEYIPTRLKLRKWVEFEQTQEALQRALNGHLTDECSRLICRVVVIALECEDVSNAPWNEVVDAYSAVVSLNFVKKIPILDATVQKEIKVPWEYDGRNWYWWVNLFAQNYGWTIPVIEDLDVNDAVSLLQEIAVDTQMDREWEWSLSEMSRSYNPTTKKSEFHKLDRPSWMEEHVNLPATKVRFRKSMLPVGRVIGEDGNERLVS